MEALLADTRKLFRLRAKDILRGDGMTIKELIEFIDEIKPNAFSDAVKTMWINDIEGKVQTDIFLMAVEDIIRYKYEDTLTEAQVCFPDDKTMVFTSAPDFIPGGKIKIFGLSTYAGNNSQDAREILNVDGVTLTFAEGTFTDTGDTPDSCTIDYDGRDIELLVNPPHDKLYRSYLAAQIDYANGEYDKYANTMQMFNAHYNEFLRWFMVNYRPAYTHRRRYQDEQL